MIKKSKTSQSTYTKYRLLATWLLLPVVLMATSVEASITDGVITSGSQVGYTWSNIAGWINFANERGGVRVSDAGLRGYAWSPNYGWINLNPANSGVKISAGGNLSGSAWSGTLGWINFSGVSIDQNGRFRGMNAVQNSGQLNFDCDHCLVQTDYRPANFRPATGAFGSMGGGAAVTSGLPETAAYKKWFEEVKNTDSDKNGIVDVLDFNTLMVNWGNGGSLSDYNSDGKVDVYDFNTLMINFGKKFTI